MYKIYGMSKCGYCVAAKELMEKNELDYEYYDIGVDNTRRKELQSLIPNLKTVPQIFKHQEHIGGFSELQSLLEAS